MNLIPKMLASILWSVIFSFSITSLLYVPQVERSSEGSYFEFLPLFTLFIFLFTPFIIVLGIFAGIIAEHISGKISWSPYWSQLLIYAGIGGLINYFFYYSLFVYGPAAVTWVLLLYGIGGGWLYMHILMFVKWLGTRKKEPDPAL
ncbi:hypothetical protein [Alkalicoccus daliensis]|uniref:Uncharacterized protein n=1 Tax=Alkalicoccus daliensis TaxID=745820 RepID=A0A1H0AYI4_9BACI|nr:hypothetical protein [Alkalicoccus daliensis]SDN38507.1 hypothetical protein SAMN04488053_101676 [Alkalicoccus daliensis]